MKQKHFHLDRATSSSVNTTQLLTLLNMNN